ncbi:RNA methyltransferase [Acidothermaceae bacterium B102]|nr:RNA methyltransferase [Acidothermaceae bacterium B102]
MADVQEITDAADPRLADYQDLTDVALRLKVEPAHGMFIAEGELVIRRALRAGYTMRSALMSPHWYASLDAEIAGVGATMYVAADDVLEQVTGFHVHRGALASFARKPLPSVAEVLATAHRVAVLDTVNNPTNLGAIIRSAAGLGIDAVLLDPRSVDHLYRRSIRVSMGEVFSLPVARLEPPWPGGLGVIREAGFRMLALTPGEHATPLDELTLGRDDKVALLFGAEGPGLSPRVLAYADATVRIPMAHGVDSLNVGAAAAVAFYAVGRR